MEERGGERRRGGVPDRERIKELGRGEDNPLCDRRSFLQIKGTFSKFPVVRLCSLFIAPLSPLLPLFPKRLRRRSRLSGINKDGCWQIKVMGRDRGLLNSQFTSHKSPPVSRRLTAATSCNKQLKTHANVLQREAHMVGSDKQTQGGWDLDSVKTNKRGNWKD